jgi:hypothetical protein
MPPLEDAPIRKRRVSIAPAYTSADEEEAGSVVSAGYRSTSNAIPLGRSYVAHAGPTSSKSWNQSWTIDSDDIREGAGARSLLPL